MPTEDTYIGLIFLSLLFRYGSLPRSTSYSGGRVSFGRNNSNRTRDNYGNYHPASIAGFDMSKDSSSSEEEEELYDYQLPRQKAYGGVRLSYVPNDR